MDEQENVDNEHKTSIFDEGSESGPGVVVPRDMTPEEFEKQLIDFIGSEEGLMVGTLDQEVLNKFAPPGDTWEWEQYQIDHLQCEENYIANKGRQMGLSASFSAKAFARGILTHNRNYTAIFTSYKKEEAVGKVKYVKQFLSALPPTFRKKIVRDPQQLIEWENRDGTRCKIISHAQTPIRGVHGDIFLDELAFYQFAKDIYESAFAATQMMGGTIDITSTHFGKFGKFYEIVTNDAEYPDYHRRWLQWWECKRYLKYQTDEFLAYAKAKAPTYGDDEEAVEKRVYEFGNEKIKKLFRNSVDITSFRQEFEGFFVDDQASFISRDLILNCMFPTAKLVIDDYDPIEEDFNVPVEEALQEHDWPIVEKYEKQNLREYDTLEELYAAVYRGDVSPNLIAGADIGTTQHSTQFTVLEEIHLSNGQTLQVERFNLSKSGWDLPDQQKYFSKVLRDGFIHKMRMDCTGVGHQMGQALGAKFPETFEALQMGGSNQKQEREMMNLRSRMENWGLAISYDKQKISDLHSIRREITPSKNISYKAQERKRHHADYAWALAFASRAGTAYGEEPVEFNMERFSSIEKTLESELGKGAKFVDDFEKDHLNKKDSGFGNALNITTSDRHIIDTEFSPGKFIPNYDEG